jgi:hypothetical protein
VQTSSEIWLFEDVCTTRRFTRTPDGRMVSLEPNQGFGGVGPGTDPRPAPIDDHPEG